MMMQGLFYMGLGFAGLGLELLSVYIFIGRGGE
jgi:hypothetical protein